MPLQVTIVGLGPIGASIGLALGTLDPHVLDVGRPVVTSALAGKRHLQHLQGPGPVRLLPVTSKSQTLAGAARARRRPCRPLSTSSTAFDVFGRHPYTSGRDRDGRHRGRSVHPAV